MSNEQKTQAAPCQCCGGTTFTPGRVSGFGRLYFWPFGRHVFSFSRSERLDARKCNTCGHVQLFGPVP